MGVEGQKQLTKLEDKRQLKLKQKQKFLPWRNIQFPTMAIFLWCPDKEKFQKMYRLKTLILMRL